MCALVVLSVLTDGAAQTSLPQCVLQGVEAGGSIVVGTISETHFGQQGQQREANASISLSVERYVRGQQSGSSILRIPVDWVDGPSKPYVLRRPIWYEVTPVVGEKILAMLLPDRDEIRTVCVLDMSSPGADLQAIEQMVALDSEPHETKVDSMIRALSDPSPAVRLLATDYLTSPQSRSPEIRSVVFHHFAPIALDSKNPGRKQALESIKMAYDGFAKDSEVNYQILSFIADLMGDADPVIRNVSVQYLYSKLFGGGRNRPNPARIVLKNRSSVVQQLKQDVAGGQPHAEEASQLLGVLEGH